MKHCTEKKCRSPLYWEVVERQLTGPELVQITSEKVTIIQQLLKTAFSRQKSYADLKRKDVLFSVGDLMFLKVSPMKGVMRFGKKGKASSKVHWAVRDSSTSWRSGLQVGVAT